MFDHMDGVMRALAKKKTQWKVDFFFAVKLARQKLSNYYGQVSPSTGMHLISAQRLNPFRKLRSFRKWYKGMDINPEDETSDTTLYHDVFLKYMQNQYCVNHRRVLVNTLENVQSSIHLPSATASGFYQSSLDPYDVSSND
jgi:hypothetical protein